MEEGGFLVETGLPGDDVKVNKSEEGCDKECPVLLLADIAPAYEMNCYKKAEQGQQQVAYQIPATLANTQSHFKMFPNDGCHKGRKEKGADWPIKNQGHKGDDDAKHKMGHGPAVKDAKFLGFFSFSHGCRVRPIYYRA